MMTIRTDDGVNQAIDFLVSQTGLSRSHVVREAVLQAEREARREAMRREAMALRDDEADLKEAQAVRSFMGGSDAW